MNWLKHRPIAHRGLHISHIENTISAFKAAIKANVPIEFDVHYTSDNEIVVFHDYTLERIYGLNVKIADVTLNELRNIKEITPCIPTLDEVLSEIKGQVPILLEIKPCNFNAAKHNILVKILREYTGEIAIQSFSNHIVFKCKRSFINIPIGCLMGELIFSNIFSRIKLLLYLLIVRIVINPNFVACHYDFLPYTYIKRIFPNDIILLCWTINKDVDNNKYNMCDNIIFE